jgi:chromosome segregation protein
MRLKSIELAGFKSFAKKTTLEFSSAITAIVGPNGSGKSNVAESFRFVLGEQSMKSMRGKRGEDLIWNGSSASPRAGRAGVRLVFDNRDRALNLDFDEVTLERVVHRDGGNDYLLNGSQVRLRDIAELLSQANIGASGHHIISQGEADRVLSSGVMERREMFEDALGLTAYLYKREDAEKKLEKAGENMREVESLRRELAPHLKFLGAQVKKIEDAHKLRDDLIEKYKEYLKRESLYLTHATRELVAEKDVPERALKALDAAIAHLRHELNREHGADAGTRELIELEAAGRKTRVERDALGRELGRLEGELTAREKLASAQEGSVPASEARTFAEKVIQEIESKGNLQALVVLAKEFLRRLMRSEDPGEHTSSLADKKRAVEKEMHALGEEEERITKALAALRKKIESEKDASREAERELFQKMSERSRHESALASLKAREMVLHKEEEEFKREAGEAAALLGGVVAQYESAAVTLHEVLSEPRVRQEERARQLERGKIRLEESGAAGAQDILKEFKETSERDQFLARELADLEQSAHKLNALIEELAKTLEVRFRGGIDKINKEFDAFFKLMFGGGSAALQIVKEKKLKRASSIDEEGDELEDGDDDVEVEEGIDILVSLPHKRIKGLHMLSGGERALTSIALIFAMSQVNPPPFLILDETDAALDEANSKRYGDMIENLAKKSQLIVITHNRETMSRAGVLYGVTMGQDGVSKLLSVKFEEAVAVAK